MCGIAGLIGRDALHARASAMADALVHRGPDESGVWVNAVGRVVFGHRRLSIIDLSDAASQPMVDSDAGLAMVFNGEIYNFKDLHRELVVAGYRFKGHSDTEVLFRGYQHWGEGILHRITGMFAFAILDEKQNKLLLARDRCGQKPLYYCRRNGEFAFASEIKALFAGDAADRKLNEQALQEYLAYGYTIGPESLVKDVYKLLPGECLTVDVATLEIESQRFWRVPQCETRVISLEEAEKQLEALLRQAVRTHLVADVPVGILLSGGLDSSLVTACAASVADKPVKTYTVTFPGHGKYDESGAARLIANHFGTEHTEIAVDEVGPEILGTLVRQFDDLIADHAMVPVYLLARQIRKEIKVALGGDGGDELFGGYPHTGWVNRQADLRQVIPRGIRRGFSKFAERHLPLGFRGRNHLVGLAGDLPWAIAQVNLYFDALTRSRLLGNGMLNTAPEMRKVELTKVRSGAKEQALYADFLTTLPEGYLAKVDRASMLASLEVRAPWLDDAIVDFAWRRIPASMKVRGRQRKILPRRLAARLLPAGANTNVKRGLTMPLANWFRGERLRFMEEVLLDSSQRLLSHAVIRNLLSLQRRGYSNQNRIFSLALLVLWCREYGLCV